MRSGRHFAVLTTTGATWSIGVVRPVQINDGLMVGDVGLDYVSPGDARLWGHLRGKRTDRWGGSNVHCCFLNIHCKRVFCDFSWRDWTSRQPYSRVDSFQHGIPIGLLFDLDEGTLSIYQRGQKLATLKDGLSGEYCWYTTLSRFGFDASVSIERGPAPGE